MTVGRSDAVTAFDALILFRGRGMRTRTLNGERTPFELELPDDDCTLVVEGRDSRAELEVEYRVERRVSST